MSKLFYGIGSNSKRNHRVKFKNKHTSAYRTWRNMLRRCYCHKFQEEQPTYIGCTVDEKWHDFQDFADWFYNQPHSEIGYQLDKDILLPNNKIYSPEMCCFIPHDLNCLLTNRALHRGDYPQGVCFDKSSNKYRSRLNLNGSKVHLGLFDCPSEAYGVYKAAKEDHVKNKALEWRDRIAPNVFNALMNWQLNA